MCKWIQNFIRNPLMTLARFCIARRFISESAYFVSRFTIFLAGEQLQPVISDFERRRLFSIGDFIKNPRHVIRFSTSQTIFTQWKSFHHEIGLFPSSVAHVSVSDPIRSWWISHMFCFREWIHNESLSFAARLW